MPEPSPPDDPLTAATSALRGDVAKARAAAASLEQRLRDRADEVLRQRLDALRSTPPPAAAAAPFTPAPLPPPAPDWPVSVRLANGQKGNAWFEPRLATRGDLAAVARVGAANDTRSFAAIRRQREQIAALKKGQEEMARQVAALQRAEQRLNGLLDSLGTLERTVDTLKEQSRKMWRSRRADRRLAARQRQRIDAQTVRSRLDQATAIVNTVQATAYGQKGSLLAGNNLGLIGNQLFWTFIDPFLQSFGITSSTSPGVLAWLAPVGALATGQVAFAGRQHVRFISGVAEIPAHRTLVRISLQDQVAASLFQELQRGRDAVATATQVAGPPAVLAARVRDGVLEIARVPAPDGGTPGPPPSSPPIIFALLAVSPSPPPVRVAWMVDLGDDIG